MNGRHAKRNWTIFILTTITSASALAMLLWSRDPPSLDWSRPFDVNNNSVMQHGEQIVTRGDGEEELRRALGEPSVDRDTKMEWNPYSGYALSASLVGPPGRRQADSFSVYGPLTTKGRP